MKLKKLQKEHVLFCFQTFGSLDKIWD